MDSCVHLSNVYIDDFVTQNYKGVDATNIH